MTECAGASHICPNTPLSKTKFGSCGILCNSFEGLIVDPETGRELGQGERGEIWMRSPSIMAGYLNRPQATADTVDRDGWLHTGQSNRYLTVVLQFSRVRSPVF